MHQSYVIEIKGTFIGAAVAAQDGFWFRAVHPRVEDLDGENWQTLDELRRATGHFFVTGRQSPVNPPTLRRAAGQ
jgi:hypothetical protein